MPCTTGVPTSQPAAPTFPFSLFFWTSCARALLSPLSTANMNFTSLWPAYQAEILLYSGDPSVADVPTSTNLMPALVRTGFAPSIRGWMFPVPGVAMIPATRSPFFTCLRICAATAAPAVRLFWPTYACRLFGVPSRDVGVVRDHGDAVARAPSRRAC